MDIYFSIPGFSGINKIINLFLLQYKRQYPERFYSNIVIDSCYDCFPTCIWNGGRAQHGYTSLKEIEQTFHDFNLYGISLRHVFTNQFLESNHLFDTFGNAILKIAAKNPIQNGITINSQLLYDYINQSYPNQFYFTWSATKTIANINILNQLSQFDNVVPSYQDVNNRLDIIKQLQYPEHIELIVNEACEDNCPYKTSHYQSFNQWQLFQTNRHQECCFQNREPNYYTLRTNHQHNISYNNIVDNYLPQKINHFKIAGRETFPLDLIESYINYFIIPEYKDRVRFDFLYFIYEQNA